MFGAVCTSLSLFVLIVARGGLPRRFTFNMNPIRVDADSVLHAGWVCPTFQIQYSYRACDHDDASHVRYEQAGNVHAGAAAVCVGICFA